MATTPHSLLSAAAVSNSNSHQLHSYHHLTAVQIPCCVCGTLIYPNAANQCSSCLAHDVDLSVQLQKGPGTAEFVTIHQCRQCRRYQQTPKHYIYAEPESPELLALCLKHIPALSGSGGGGGGGNGNSTNNHHHNAIRIIDASWVWTEPHSMRYKIRITAQTEVQGVTIQQRVLVELRCTFQMCSDCNREYTNRTWQAVLQVRQRHTTRGIRGLEMALADADRAVRQHVIRLDSTNAGLDFYFLQLRHAQQLAQFIAGQYPCRIKSTQKFVSEDVKNNTANIKHTVSCELVPLAKDDLIVLAAASASSSASSSSGSRRHCHIPSPLAGRVGLVTRVSAGLIQCVDAVTMDKVDITADLYYRYEKSIHIIQKVPTVRAIVLDVVVVDQHQQHQQHHRKQQRPQQQPEPQPQRHGEQQQHPPPVRHEVQLLYAHNGGGGNGDSNNSSNNDATVTTRTHVGRYLTAGDTVLAYDLRNSTVPIYEEWLNHAYQLPDIIVLKKAKPGMDDDGDHYNEDHDNGKDNGKALTMMEEKEEEEKSTTSNNNHNNNNNKLSKKKERRQRKENRRMRELEERAARMGFIDNGGHDDDDDDDNDQVEDEDLFVLPNEMADEVARLEEELLVDRGMLQAEQAVVDPTHPVSIQHNA